MILLNAIYFKGNWLHKFENKRTHNRKFYLTKQIQKLVPTMTIFEKFYHGEIPALNAKFIVLPYEVVSHLFLFNY